MCGLDTHHLPGRGLTRPAQRLLFVLLFLTAGCGGGGGGGGGLPTEDLGTFASTIPSTIDIAFTNPLSQPTTVTQLAFDGPFAIDPGDLPASAAAGGEVILGVVFTPSGDGTDTGTVTIRFSGASASREVTRRFQATGEAVTWTIDPSDLDFGTVDADADAERSVTLTNQSTLSPVTISAVNFPHPAFEVMSPLPVVVDPLSSALLTVRFAPKYGGTYDGTAVFGPFDAGAGVKVPLLANAPGGGSEQVIDFGYVAYDSEGRTAERSFDVPPDGVSFMIEAKGDSNQYIGLAELIPPNGDPFEEIGSTGAFAWVPGVEVFTAQVPNTDKPALQIQSGTWRFRLDKIRRGGGVDIRVIIERRPNPAAQNGVLPLNVWLAQGIPPTAATATSDVRLQLILGRVADILAEQDLVVGDIDYYDVADSSFDHVHRGEIDEVLQTTSAATEVRLNLFFVEQVIGGGVVGVAGMVGGPKCNGTGTSGVLSVFDDFPVSTVSLVAAHEIGHLLGLVHSTEDDGTPDHIDDTPIGTEGDNLMYWQAIGGTNLTAGQGLVMRGHPLVLPGPGTPPQFVAPTTLLERVPEHDHAWRLQPGWCGICRAGRNPVIVEDD